MKKSEGLHKTYSRKSLIVQLITLTILYFVVSILVESANWFQTSWGEISFATVVYQLSTPLEGTEGGIIVSYVQQVIPKVVTRLLLAFVLYYLLNRIFSAVIVRFHIRIKNKELKLSFGKRFLTFGRVMFWIILAMTSVLEISLKVEALGIDEFISDIRSSSTIFEDYYVDPSDINITFPTEKRNLIFIYLESMENTYASVEAGGGKPVNYIPELTELAEEYVNISNTEYLGGVFPCALTDWTIAAILGSSSGIPYKIPGDEISGENSAGKYTEFLPGLVCLGDILESEGYRNYFLCGSRGEFAGRELYYQKHGNYEVMDYFYAEENGYIPEDYYVFWGYEDAKLFDIAKKRLGEIAASDEPFNFTMLTVDTHYPEGYLCELCKDEYEEKLANVISCSSRQTYDFVKWIMEQEWYENTTIILLGDHNSMSNNFWDDIGDFERRTYNCFINLPNEVDTSNVKNRNVCTLDIFPTTIAALGAKIDGDRLGLGTNVFSDKKTLTEELGQEYLNQEINRYSVFYNKKFVRNE